MHRAFARGWLAESACGALAIGIRGVDASAEDREGTRSGERTLRRARRARRAHRGKTKRGQRPAAEVTRVSHHPHGLKTRVTDAPFVTRVSNPCGHHGDQRPHAFAVFDLSSPPLCALRALCALRFAFPTRCFRPRRPRQGDQRRLAESSRAARTNARAAQLFTRRAVFSSRPRTSLKTISDSVPKTRARAAQSFW